MNIEKAAVVFVISAIFSWGFILCRKLTINKIITKQIKYKHTVDSIYIDQTRTIDLLNSQIDSCNVYYEDQLNKAENEIEELDILLYNVTHHGN